MMMTAIHQSPPLNGYTVPGPRSTDAIGVALRGAYRDIRPLPEAMAAALRALDRIADA